MIKIIDILEKIDYVMYTGGKDLCVENVIPLKQIREYEGVNLTWCNDKNLNSLENVNASTIIIVSKDVSETIKSKLNCIIVDNPRKVFQEVLVTFFVEKTVSKIESSSIIHSSVKLGKNIYIGENVIIEKDCVIGDNTRISHNTTILKDTIIGDNVVIGCNNTIGGVGFGYEKNKDGDFEVIPHIGNVVIHNNVDIGSNTCIDRAVLGSTILEENVKVDNLVHIAHGVHLKRNCVVIANAMIAGSVVVGENSWIAPSASIINQKVIGDYALVGLGAVVTKDVDDNSIVAGNPAKFIRKIN